MQNKLKQIIGKPAVIYSVILFLKLMIIRHILFGEINVLSSLATDMPFILLFIMFAVLLPNTRLFNLFLVNLFYSIVFFILIVYVKYYQILPTYYDLFQINQVGTIKSDIYDLINPRYYLVFIDVIIVYVILKFYQKRTRNNGTLTSGLVIICIICISAQFYFNKNKQITDVLALANNKGIFQYELMQYYQDKALPALADKENLSNEKIYALKGLKSLNQKDIKYFNIASGKNVIIIQLESFQNFLIDLKVDDKEVTPTLNSLVKDSFYFSNTYQQIGAGNTSDAEFLINTSLYPAGNKPSSKIYEDKIIPSLPRVLSKHGYYTATFHADNVEYWNRIKLYPSLGFDKYYEESFFGDKEVIGFGPSDEVLYEETLKELSDLTAKYNKIYAHVLSMTSHTPFELPEEKQRIQLPQQFNHTKIGNYLKSTNYADYALGKFINGLKERDLWQNSIVVIYGDHSGYHPKPEEVKDKKLMENILGHPYGLADRFNIPLLIHLPGDYKGKVSNLAGQIDIMPTVTNLLGVNINNQIHFGHDLLNYENNILGMRYYLPAGSYFDKEFLFVNREEKGRGEVYNLQTKELIVKNEPFYVENSKAFKKKDTILKLLNLSDYYLNNLPEKDDKSF
ncbi:LTA synthase family protein [Fictibacillus nanhaiensis]|uniref:LTA synthase family protein n=1 Tax=Fictibacillus nanhaiensis TaxID=742169 RepID=A0ABS2ZNV3_9BACL|nr:LTA synthase family protein [Fictibacillus nanhaiensis]